MNKNIIISGAGKGIGFELSKKLAASGHQVLALSRNIEAFQKWNHPNITAMSFDLCKPSDFSKLIPLLKKLKSVDILINNAGFLILKTFAELTDDDFQKVFDVNFFGAVRLIRTVLPFMKKTSHVVNISSIGGVQGSVKFPGLAAYSSAKGAIITLTELLAEEHKESGPSFNALALGAVQTEMLEEAFPGYQAPISAEGMAMYIADFALNGNKYYNGKILQVSASTP